jgi:hypothetical protein
MQLAERHIIKSTELRLALLIESCVLGPVVNPLEVKKKGEGLNASHVTHR